MNHVWRKIWRRKGRRAIKYTFTISPKELGIEYAGTKHEPTRVVVALKRRKRRYECKPHVTEPSSSDARRRLVQWHEDAAVDSMTFTITLFRDEKRGMFDDKKWTLVVESLDANERAHPVAAVALNLRLFVGASVEAKLRLHPLRPDVSQCMMILNCGSVVSPTSVRESIASAAPAEVANGVTAQERERTGICAPPSLPVEEGTGGKNIASTSYVDENFVFSRPKIAAFSADFREGLSPTLEEEPLCLSLVLMALEVLERLKLPEDEEDEEGIRAELHVSEDATWKITTNFEKEIHQPASKIQIEVEKIAERVSEVEKLDSYVEQKMRNTEAGSEDEQKYINQHLKLLTEKDSLVRRQDYLNVLIDLKETVAKIEELQRLVNQITTDELLHTNKTAELMIELKNLIDKKDELSHTLIDKEAEEEEENERGKRLLQKSQNFMRDKEAEEEDERAKRLLQQSRNFVRGVEESLSASERIFNWFNSPRTTTTN